MLTRCIFATAGRPGTLRSVAAVLEHSGDSWFWAAVLELVGWRGGPQRRQWSALLFGANLVVALGVQALKLLLRRSRPAESAAPSTAKPTYTHFRPGVPPAEPCCWGWVMCWGRHGLPY